MFLINFSWRSSSAFSTPRTGRRSALRSARKSGSNSLRVRARVFLCIRNVGAALVSFQLTSWRAVRMHEFGQTSLELQSENPAHLFMNARQRSGPHQICECL